MMPAIIAFDEIEIEREIDARRMRSPIKRRKPVLPGAERGDAIAALIANGPEQIDAVHELERDQRVAESAVVPVELGERALEVRARQASAAHEVLAEKLVSLRRDHVVEPAALEVDLLAHAASVEAAHHEERARFAALAQEGERLEHGLIGEHELVVGRARARDPAGHGGRRGQDVPRELFDVGNSAKGAAEERHFVAAAELARGDELDDASEGEPARAPRP